MSALSGVRVADFSWAWAGAHAGTILAFMGAEVIKVESQRILDWSRRSSLTTGQVFDDPNRSEVFNDINMNKMAVQLNLQSPRGVEMARRLVAVSDVVLQNMRPGAMEDMGLGYEELKKVRPDIIYMSSSARGSTGPEAGHIGVAPCFSALSGLSSITGYADGPPTAIAGEIDLLSAYTAAFAILAALNCRQRTGRGQHIDLSSSEAISVLIGEVLLDYTVNGRVQSRSGNRDGFMAPHNCYRCRGDDSWVSIAIASDEEWVAFAGAIGRPGWADDERFRDAYSRWLHQEELDRLVGEWTSKHTHYEVMEILQRAGVAAVPSFSSQDLTGDRHLAEREAWVEVEHPVIGKQLVATPPWKLSGTPASVRSHGPLLGEHNNYVLGDLLGLVPADIERLGEEGVVY